jgi:hypothetical protein
VPTAEGVTDLPAFATRKRCGRGLSPRSAAVSAGSLAPICYLLRPEPREHRKVLHRRSQRPRRLFKKQLAKEAKVRHFWLPNATFRIQPPSDLSSAIYRLWAIGYALRRLCASRRHALRPEALRNPGLVPITHVALKERKKPLSAKRRDRRKHAHADWVKKTL